MGSEKIFMFGEPSTGGRADLTAILPALMNNNKGIDPNILAMLGNRDGNGRDGFGNDFFAILLLFSPAAGSEGYPVSIATTPANSTTTTSSKTPLINGSGDQMLSSEITQGNRYLIFYDKCNGTFQTINHIVPPTAAASNSGE